MDCRRTSFSPTCSATVLEMEARTPREYCLYGCALRIAPAKRTAKVRVNSETDVSVCGSKGNGASEGLALAAVTGANRPGSGAVAHIDAAALAKSFG